MTGSHCKVWSKGGAYTRQIEKAAILNRKKGTHERTRPVGTPWTLAREKDGLVPDGGREGSETPSASASVLQVRANRCCS